MISIKEVIDFVKKENQNERSIGDTPAEELVKEVKSFKPDVEKFSKSVESAEGLDISIYEQLVKLNGFAERILGYLTPSLDDLEEERESKSPIGRSIPGARGTGLGGPLASGGDEEPEDNSSTMSRMWDTAIGWFLGSKAGRIWSSALMGAASTLGVLSKSAGAIWGVLKFLTKLVKHPLISIPLLAVGGLKLATNALDNIREDRLNATNEKVNEALSNVELEENEDGTSTITEKSMPSIREALTESRRAGSWDYSGIEATNDILAEADNLPPSPEVIRAKIKSALDSDDPDAALLEVAKWALRKSDKPELANDPTAIANMLTEMGSEMSRMEVPIQDKSNGLERLNRLANEMFGVAEESKNYGPQEPTIIEKGIQTIRDIFTTSSAAGVYNDVSKSSPMVIASGDTINNYSSVTQNRAGSSSGPVVTTDSFNNYRMYS